MNELSKYQSYASLFGDYIKELRLEILTLGILVVISFFIGMALILFALILGNFKENFLIEFMKLLIGLISSTASSVQITKILERRKSIVSCRFIKKRFENFENLSREDRQSYTEIANEFLKKVLP